jgi:hypothetical protein
MLKKEESEWTYEMTTDGKKVYAKEVSDTLEKSKLTVTELRDFLNEMIDAGYGNYSVEADTQDGNSYRVGNIVMVFDVSKIVKIF